MKAVTDNLQLIDKTQMMSNITYAIAITLIVLWIVLFALFKINSLWIHALLIAAGIIFLFRIVVSKK